MHSWNVFSSIRQPVNFFKNPIAIFGRRQINESRNGSLGAQLEGELDEENTGRAAKRSESEGGGRASTKKAEGPNDS